MKYILLFLIRLYQKTLSYDYGIMGKLFPNNRPCKFHPTCSQYGYDAIKKYGVFKGGRLTLNRIIRCNPRTEPGQYDPVP